MPHDMKGNLVQKGDVVMVPCVVEAVHEDPQFCNVTLKTVRPMPPYTEGTTVVLNAQQCEKVEPTLEG